MLGCSPAYTPTTPTRLWTCRASAQGKAEYRGLDMFCTPKCLPTSGLVSLDALGSNHCFRGSQSGQHAVFNGAYS